MQELPDTKTSVCLRNCVLILDVWLFGVKTAQTGIVCPMQLAAEHRELKGSWMRWKVSQLKTKNKSKDKPASDALT